MTRRPARAGVVECERRSRYGWPEPGRPRRAVGRRRRARPSSADRDERASIRAIRSANRSRASGSSGRFTRGPEGRQGFAAQLLQRPRRLLADHAVGRVEALDQLLRREVAGQGRRREQAPSSRLTSVAPLSVLCLFSTLWRSGKSLRARGRPGSRTPPRIGRGACCK